MRQIQLRDAKATLSAVIDEAVQGEPSVITATEIEDGICRSRRAGAQAKAGRLAEWLETFLHRYADRVLPIDLAVARRTGVLTDHARRQGHDPGLAVERGYTVLPRNVRHFALLAVAVIDPLRRIAAGC